MRFTVVNMPLVRTTIAAPSRVYERFPLPGPQQAVAKRRAAEVLAIASLLRGIRR